MARNRIAHIALAALALSSAACRQGEGQPQAVGDSARGYSHAAQICARCHAIERGEARSPEAGVPSFQAIADTPGMTSIALNAWLHTPHPSMPNFILDPDAVADVSAYILSLRESD